jgi:hypothetical protein
VDGSVTWQKIDQKMGWSIISTASTWIHISKKLLAFKAFF